MTKEEAAHISDVLKAYSKGKSIEYKEKREDIWHDFTNQKTGIQ